MATLETAIGQAHAIARAEREIDDSFADLVRHVHKMHAILSEGLAANPKLASEGMRCLERATGNAADELEATAARIAGRLH